MHRIRHFPAVEKLLNSTPRAEACNVTQPSRTHAIKQLEDELRVSCSIASEVLQDAHRPASPPTRAYDMPILVLAAALGASCCWAVGSVIAHRPATQLGAFEFTRTQLISSSALLIVVVTALSGWQSVTWAYWPSYVVASLVGVIFTNLAMIACLRRGGPRRMQLLVSMSGPITTLLGFSVLGESMSLRKLLGVGLAFSGLFLAILFGRRGQSRFEFNSGLSRGRDFARSFRGDLSCGRACHLKARAPGGDRPPCGDCTAHRRSGLDYLSRSFMAVTGFRSFNEADSGCCASCDPARLHRIYRCRQSTALCLTQL